MTNGSKILRNLSLAGLGLAALLFVWSAVSDLTAPPVPRIDVYEKGKVVRRITDPKEMADYEASLRTRASTASTQPAYNVEANN